MIGGKRPGVTLIETLVAATIFVIIVVAMTAAYLQSTRAGQQIAIRSRLESDGRYALEAISRAIRVYAIDYAAYAAPAGPLPAQPMTELCLKQPDVRGGQLRIRRETTDAGCYNDGKSFPCMVVSTDAVSACDASGSWAPLTPQNTKIEYASFYASPANDPLYVSTITNDYAANAAERVTVVLGLHGLAARPADEWVLNLQTTVTPRLYRR
jgi:hypothetical protein